MFKISIIGSGHLATHFAHRFLEQKCKIHSIYSKTLAHSHILAEQLGAEVVQDISQLNLSEIDFIFICTSDDVIQTIAQQIPATKAILIHCSGAKGFEVFSQKQWSGIIYPLQTFSKGIPFDWEKVPLFLCSQYPEQHKKIEDLASVLSPKIQWIDPQEKIKLHIAAVIACNFSNYMYGLAEEILRQVNLPFQTMAPLLEATLSKALSHSPSSVQTGPARRQDLQTLALHEKKLEQDPEILEVYHYISEKIKTHYGKQ